VKKRKENITGPPQMAKQKSERKQTKNKKVRREKNKVLSERTNSKFPFVDMCIDYFRNKFFFFEGGHEPSCTFRQNKHFLAKPLLDEEHELLLALVSHFHIFDELTELDRSILSQKESLPSFGQKVDKVTIMSRTDVRQPRMRRVHVGRYGCI